MHIKEFSSFDVAAVVKELKEKILGSRVSNLYQLDHKTLLFKLHKSGMSPIALLIESGRRIHLTSYMLEKPSSPPAFCMALRKYLRNSLLTNIEQHDFERIVTLSFRAKGDFSLIVELFGEGNLILLNEKSEILHALTYKRMRDRNILRGEKFLFPPISGKDPFKITREEMHEELKKFGDIEVVRAITKLLSIGGFYAEEILLRTAINKTKLCNALSEAELNAIYDNMQSLLLQTTSGKLEPCAILDDAGRIIDVSPFRLLRYSDYKHKIYDSFNEALDEFYTLTKKLEMEKAEVEITKLRQEYERVKRIIEDQKKTLADAEATAQKYKKIAETIYAHLNDFQTLISRFLTAKESGKSWDTVAAEILTEKKAGLTPSMFFESFDKKNLSINVSAEGLRFSLNLREGLFDIAGHFYEQSKRAKQKLDGAKAALEETSRKILEIEEKIRKAEALEHVTPSEAAKELLKRKIKRKEWFEKFRWFISSDGFLVVAGKDATSNEVLIKKYTTAEDIVFHADITGAPFVVIKTEGKKPSEQCISEAGEFAAAFSRAWREGFASIDVYWVKPDQLSKGGASGEYVPRGAFVVEGKRNWLHGIPLKLAVGFAIAEGEIEFFGGPVEAIKSKANAYVTLTPGDLTGKELLKNILKELAQKAPKEHREKLLKASIEQIREFIPYGKGRILQES